MQPEPAELSPAEETELLQIVDLTAQELPPPGAVSGEAAAQPDSATERENIRSRSVSTKPPTAAEWQNFLGKTVLRLATEGYLYLVLFRHFDENELTPRELESVRLTAEELCEIAAPVATVASKNKLAKKHGRTIIASAESYESVIDLFFWMKRVNKIARKYKPVRVTSKKPDNAEPHIEGVVFNGPVPRQDDPTTAASGRHATTGPNIAGIFNPGTG